MTLKSKFGFLTLLILVSGSLFVSSCVQAGWRTITGHVKGQFQNQYWSDDQYQLDDNPTQLFAGDLRLNSGYDKGNWQFNVNYQLNGQTGTSTELQQRLSPWEDPDETQLFNLTSDMVDDSDTLIWQSLDRFNISYTDQQYAVKFGRQALSWGRGQLFNPMDLFNPFSPYAIDTEYKPGTDMLNAQWLSAAGNDLTAVMIPRRNIETGDLDASQSSTAVKWHQLDNNLEWQVMAARDYEDWVTSLSFSGALGEASWNLDIVPTYVDAEEEIKTSAVLNLNHAWIVSDHNVTGFIEYYFNGYGESDTSPAITQLNTSLVTKQSRNQVFVINQHYLDLGMTVEWTPLLNISPSLIQNLQDGSGLLVVSGLYSLSDDSQFLLGAQLPYGKKGTEYGGLYVTEQRNEVLAQPLRIYAQLNIYF